MYNPIVRVMFHGATFFSVETTFDELFLDNAWLLYRKDEIKESLEKHGSFFVHGSIEIGKVLPVKLVA